MQYIRLQKTYMKGYGKHSKIEGERKMFGYFRAATRVGREALVMVERRNIFVTGIGVFGYRNAVEIYHDCDESLRYHPCVHIQLYKNVQFPGTKTW